MPILIAIVTWMVAATFSRADFASVAFLFAVMAWYIARQSQRISNLEKSIKVDATSEAPPLSKRAVFVEEDASVPSQPIAEPVLVSEKQEEPHASDPRKVASIDEAVVYSRPSLTNDAAHHLENLLGPALAGFVLTGNPIARIGVIVLFFGVTFALKLVVDQGYLPIEVRLICAALGAFALLGLGWRMRIKKRQFGVTLQGAGAGIFYITVFVAFRLYHLIPGPLAFCLLVGITILSTLLAVLQDARSLAFLGAVGGFLAPALTSEGGGNYILLFGYMALLNLGIFGLSWFRSWRELHITGLLFTFAIALGWGTRYYQPELYAVCQAFLIFFIIIFSVNTIIAASKNRAGKYGSIDTIMTFGTPFAAFLLQYGLVRNYEYGLAWSSCALGSFHIALARIIFQRFKVLLRYLVESYFAVGLFFLSLAVPLAFSGRLTAAIWAVEGLALVWSGVRQRHWLTRLAGQVLIILTSIFFLSDIRYSSSDMAFLNPYFEGIVLLAMAHLLSARLLSGADKETVSVAEKQFAPILSWLGLLWWIGGGFSEISRHLAHWYHALSPQFPTLNWRAVPFGANVYSLFASLTAVTFWLLERYFSIQKFRFLRSWLMPFHLFLLIALFSAGGSSQHYWYRVHPFMSLGFISWSVLILAHYGMLYIQERDAVATNKVVSHHWGLHVWALVISTIVVTWEFFSLIGRSIPETNSWSVSALMIVPALVLIFGTRECVAAARWPFLNSSAAYLKSLGILTRWLLGVTVWTSISEAGSADPLFYLPVLNPLDIGQLLVAFGLIKWWFACQEKSIDVSPSPKSAIYLMSIWSFVWVTAVLLRSVHHYAEIPWNFVDLFESNVAQAALSIFWSALALVLMSLAHKNSWRVVWKAGAFLIGLVVIKLFLIELSSQGTVARIAAFLGVGILMLCIGYLAPIPPEKTISKRSD